MKLYSIEGNIQKLDGGAMYGNAPKEVWKNWTPPDEKNRIQLACRCLLLHTDDNRKILFETGIGAFFDDKLKERYGVSPKEHLLLENLKKINMSDTDIDAVVISHLHFDHAGGLLSAYGDGEPHLLFPRAKFYVGARQWERAVSPHQRDKASYIPVLQKLLKESGRLVLVTDDGVSDLTPLVTFIFSDGHTPGLMLSKIKLSSGEFLVFVSDLIPAVPWVRTSITMGYDRFPEMVIDEKENLLKDLAKCKGKLFFTHDPQIVCGEVIIDETGKYTVKPINLAELY